MSETTGSGTYGCPYCGTYPCHPPQACPMVSEIEYYENGTIKKIVKRDALNWGSHRSVVQWPLKDRGGWL